MLYYDINPNPVLKGFLFQKCYIFFILWNKKEDI